MAKMRIKAHQMRHKLTDLCLRRSLWGDKSITMALGLNRRFVALITAMLFAVSVGAHGFTVSHASTQAMDVMAASDTQSSTPDSGCGGNDGGMACFALCAGAVAILPEPIALPKMLAMVGPVASSEQFISSRNIAPDPAPPRSVVLS